MPGATPRCYTMEHVDLCHDVMVCPMVERMKTDCPTGSPTLGMFSRNGTFHMPWDNHGHPTWCVCRTVHATSHGVSDESQQSHTQNYAPWTVFVHRMYHVPYDIRPTISIFHMESYMVSTWVHMAYDRQAHRFLSRTLEKKSTLPWYRTMA